jgi:hypothetical protein
MSWQSVLVLVVLGLLVAAAIWFGVAYSRIKKKWQAAQLDCAEMKGELEGSRDDVQRLLSMIEIGRLTDADLAKRIRERLARWSPIAAGNTAANPGGADPVGVGKPG